KTEHFLLAKHIRAPLSVEINKFMSKILGCHPFSFPVAIGPKLVGKFMHHCLPKRKSTRGAVRGCVASI
ncbi:hypothetical protein, partial [Brevibacillus agri]|uniref:hypothetical protein n=1 Tax=Brevibacillus agri TaxID=51101 RepID=UPI001C8E8976